MVEGPFNPLDPDDALFRPPAIPTLVHCVHCGQEYESYLMQRVTDTDAAGRAFEVWCCPVEECDGRGFGLDIFPVDPDYIGEDGQAMWAHDDDTDDDEADSDEWDDADDWTPDAEWPGDEAATGEVSSDDATGDEDLPW